MQRAQVLLNHFKSEQSDAVSAAPTASEAFKQKMPTTKYAPASVGTDFFNLDDLLTPEERALRHHVRKVMVEEFAPHVNAWWEKAEFNRDVIVEKAKKLKIGGGSVKGYGCAGVSHLSMALAVVEMARVDPSICTFALVQNCLAILSIALCGSEEQKNKFLPKMAAFDSIGCFGLTEPDFGSDASSLQTSATPVDGGFLLKGNKRWIGNGTVCNVAIIWARNSQTKQVEGFIVHEPHTQKGWTATKIEGKMSLRTVQNADIEMDNLFVPAENRLANAPNFQDGVNRVLAVSRILVAWMPVGISMGIYDNALAYVKSRKQFGVPLANFQLVQDKLVQMQGHIVGMTYMAYRLSQLYQSGKMTVGQSSLAKAWTTSRGREVAALGREVLGGNGIVIDWHAARLFCDAESIYSYEGTRDINLLVAGRELTGASAIRAPLPKKK